MRLSYSTVDIFDQCRRWFYYAKIAKLEVFQDKMYMDRGTCVHLCLEKFYNGKIIELKKLREHFDIFWDSHGLKETFESEREKSWLMVLNGVALKLHVTHTEYKFRFHVPDYIGYADIMDRDNHVIGDWKTSSWKSTNHSETQYRKQMLYYSWAYYREFNIIPKCYVYYLKVDKEVSFEFTHEEIIELNNEIKNKQNFIDNHRNKEDYPMVTDTHNLCPFFCPYKEQCFATEKFEVELTKCGPFIRIDSFVPDILKKMLIKKFSYEKQNAHFIRKNSNWDGFVKLYNDKSQTLGCGFQNHLIKIMQAYANHKKIAFDINIKDKNRKMNKIFETHKSTVILRDYQQEAVDVILKFKNGVIQIATGGGKTEIAVEAINQLGVKSLFVVDRVDLLNQTIARFNKTLELNEDEIGVIQGDRVIINKPITVATIQTLLNNKNRLNNFFKDIDFVVFDECHAVAAKSYVTLNKLLTQAQYRIGLSATPYRDDGEDMRITEFCGEVIYKKTPKELMKAGYIMYPTIEFLDYDSELDLATNYIDDYKFNIIENKGRNKAILEFVNNHSNKKILILVKSVRHGEMLSDNILNSYHHHGTLRPKKREIGMKLFRSSVINVMIATISMVKQGLDIKDLDIIINAAGNKGDVITTQVIGRVVRKFLGKKEALYIDFMDKGYHTKKHSKKRYKNLKDQEYELKIKKV